MSFLSHRQQNVRQQVNVIRHRATAGLFASRLPMAEKSQVTDLSCGAVSLAEIHGLSEAPGFDRNC
jgi:hypothetical protein